MYNLILAPDVNTNRKYQWFYFEVSNTKAQVSYVFNIINCDKTNTQYNHGMQPVLFSVKDATLGKIGTEDDLSFYIFCFRFCISSILIPKILYYHEV